MPIKWSIEGDRMGFAIGGTQGTSTILAELAFPEGDQSTAEGLTLPEMGELGEVQRGALPGTSNVYVVIKSLGTDLPQWHPSLLTPPQGGSPTPLSDSKNFDPSPLLQGKPLQEKEFVHLPQKLFDAGGDKQLPKQEEVVTKGDGRRERAPVFSHKTDQATRPFFKTPLTGTQESHHAGKSGQPQETHFQRGVPPLHQGLERRREGERARESTTRSEERKAVTRLLEGRSSLNHQKLDRPLQPKSKEEQEEGFADGQRDGSQQQEDDQQQEEKGVVKVDSTFAGAMCSYGAEESILSQLFNMRVSQFDVLILFLEIMKLDIKSRELQKLFRREEREAQIMHMQQVVANYKEQANAQLFSSLGSGILAIISGVTPIVGYMKGEWILEKLAGTFTSLQDMKKDQFFRGIAKVTFALSEMNKNTGQIHNTFSEGWRTYHQHMSEIYRAEYDERNRTIEDIKDNWKAIENFLYQTLQMYHEAIRALYHG
jgi:hypothetical protein